MHARWVICPSKYQYVFSHKVGIHNEVVDALSRKMCLLNTLKAEVNGFEAFKEQYSTDVDFQDIWEKCVLKEHVSDFHIQKGYLFKGTQLCIPTGSLRTLIVKEFHSNSISAHTGQDKTHSCGKKILLATYASRRC